jgi:NADH-quinone oxidoreductase subunit C
MTNQLNIDRVKEIISSIVGEIRIDNSSTPVSIIIPVEKILDICDQLHKYPNLYFDSLSCLTAIDNGKEAGTMEVIYNLYSIPFNHHLMLKVILSREIPEIESVASIWRTANWQEREAFDMFGIHFKNHPDLRRILMPADWEGFPLRKDYQQQETYRDIKVAYHNE